MLYYAGDIVEYLTQQTKLLAAFHLFLCTAFKCQRVQIFSLFKRPLITTN